MFHISSLLILYLKWKEEGKEMFLFSVLFKYIEIVIYKDTYTSDSISPLPSPGISMVG